MPYGEPGIDLGLLNFLATSTGETIADQVLVDLQGAEIATRKAQA